MGVWGAAHRGGGCRAPGCPAGQAARVALGALGGLLAGSAGAFGLGEIDRQSALGQPLAVDIELTLDASEPLDSVQVRLANGAAYEDAGLERAGILENVTASIVQRDGRSFVHLAARDHVGEPYLPLLVEAVRGKATLRHAYDLLLDPPLAGFPAAPPAGAPVATEAEAPAEPARATRHAHHPAGPSRLPLPHAVPESALPTAEAPEPPGLGRIRFTYALEGPVPPPALPLRLSLRLAVLPAPVPQPATPPGPVPASGAPAKASATNPPEPAPDRHGLAWLALLAALLMGYRLWRGRHPAEATEPDSARRPRSAFAAAAALAIPAPSPAPAPTPPPSPASQDWHSATSVATYRLVERPVLEEPVSTGADFFGNVADFLLQTLQREPQRGDLRMKLLEVYYAAGRVDAYVEQAREYAAVIDLRQDRLWPEITRMGLELAPGNALFTGAPPPPAMVALPETASVPIRTRRYFEGLPAERLEPQLSRLSRLYGEAAIDPDFQKQFRRDLRELLRRPSDLQNAPRYSMRHGGAQIFLKREDAHGAQDRELINAIGQIALARYIGAKRVVAGALHSGNHAVATARIAAKKGLRCQIFASEATLDSTSVKLRTLKELGAEVRFSWPERASEPDPRRAAMEAWLDSPEDTLFISSLSTGPSPFPRIVLDFQTVVGQEVRRQLAAEKTRRRADALIAYSEGGYETFGLLAPYLTSKATKLYTAVPVDVPLTGMEADETPPPFRQMSRERAWLRDTGRVGARSVSYESALRAVDELAQMDGITVAVEDGYALACAADIGASMSSTRTIVALMGASRA